MKTVGLTLKGFVFATALRFMPKKWRVPFIAWWFRKWHPLMREELQKIREERERKQRGETNG